MRHIRGKRLIFGEAIVMLYAIAIMIYSFATAIRGIGDFAIIGVSVACMIYLLFPLLRVRIGLGEALWIISALVMILWTRRLDAEVVGYDAIFLLTIVGMTALLSESLPRALNILIKVLIGFSLGLLLFVMFEYILGLKFLSIFEGLFSPTQFVEEVNHLQMRTGLRGFSSSPNALSFAALAVLCWVVFLWQGKSNKVARLCLAILAIAVLVVCGERSNFIFIPLAIGLAYIAQSRSLISLKTMKTVFAAFVFTAVVLIFSPLLQQIPSLDKMFAFLGSIQGGNNISESDAGRLVLYNKAFEMFQEKPFFGNGWFEFYYQNTGILYPDVRSFAHNMYLEALAECGIVGSLLLFLPMTYSLYLTVSLIKKTSNGSSASSSYSKILCFGLAVQLFFLLDTTLHLTNYSPRLIIYLVAVFLTFHVQRKVEIEARDKRLTMEGDARSRWLD